MVINLILDIPLPLIVKGNLEDIIIMGKAMGNLIG